MSKIQAWFVVFQKFSIGAAPLDTVALQCSQKSAAAEYGILSDSVAVVHFAAIEKQLLGNGRHHQDLGSLFLKLIVGGVDNSKQLGIHMLEAKAEDKMWKL